MKRCPRGGENALEEMEEMEEMEELETNSKSTKNSSACKTLQQIPPTICLEFNRSGITFHVPIFMRNVY